MSMPKTITGTLTAWFPSSYTGPKDLDDAGDKAVALLCYFSGEKPPIDGWSKAGTASITVAMLSPDEMVDAKITALRDQKKKLLAETQNAVTSIDSKIQQLLAITMTEVA